MLQCIQSFFVLGPCSYDGLIVDLWQKFKAIPSDCCWEFSLSTGLINFLLWFLRGIRINKWHVTCFFCAANLQICIQKIVVYTAWIPNRYNRTWIPDEIHAGFSTEYSWDMALQHFYEKCFAVTIYIIINLFIYWLIYLFIFSIYSMYCDNRIYKHWCKRPEVII